MPVELTSPVWNATERVEVASRCLTRLAKRFKVERVSAMSAGPHTGVVYKRSGGGNFQRFHRASARGERPAPDTNNLLNSVKDQKIASLQHAVYVDDAKAPYGKWLQDPLVLDRPIATLADAEDFMKTQAAVSELNKAGGEMAGGITGETL